LNICFAIFTTGDEFSSDEFSDGEFDSLSNTYENLRVDKADASSSSNVVNGDDQIDDDDDDDNVYDVAEFVEGDSLVEKSPFAEAEISKRDLPAAMPSQLMQEREAQLLPAEAATPNVAESVAHGVVSDDAEAGECLIENEGEKTIIFTSAAIASSSSQSKHNERNSDNRSSAAEHQILISSSSWIDLQGSGGGHAKSQDSADSVPFGSLPVVSCKFGGSVPTDVCKLEVGSISIGGRPRQQLSEWSVSADPGITLDSLEPIKPPRLKKIARMQKQQQLQQQQQQLVRQQQHDLLRHVMHRDKFKMSNRSQHHQQLHHHHPQQQQQQQQQQQHRVHASTARPDISAPILLATTLNPNDADGHRTLSAFSAGTILSHLEQLNRQHRQIPSANQVIR
jgi:hypothetical protein